MKMIGDTNSTSLPSGFYMTLYNTNYTQNSSNWLPSEGIPFLNIDSNTPESVATVNSTKSTITVQCKCLVIAKFACAYDGTTNCGNSIIMANARAQGPVNNQFKEITLMRVMTAGQTIYAQLYGQASNPQNYNQVNSLNIAFIPIA